MERLRALSMNRSSSPASRFAAAAVAVLIGASFVAMGGCARALFPRNAPRTQYETYDRLRNAWVPAEELDVFGNPQPALRARLSQPQ